MKREIEEGRRGGASRSGEQTITKDRRPVTKIFTEKKATKLSKAKVQRIKTRRIRAEAAYEQLDDEELCRDLSSKFALQSAGRTDDPIGDVRERYDAIVLGFVAMRQQVDGERQSLIRFLLGENQTTEAIKAFFETPGKWLGEDLLTAFAEEYVRDRDALMQFLLACLKRWRKLDEPESRARFVTQQIARRYGHNRTRIAEELLKRGVIRNRPTKENEWNSLRSRIGQWLSRDQIKAVKDGFGPRERLRPTSFGHLLRRPSEFAVRRNV
jgi:hypothetical protein